MTLLRFTRMITVPSGISVKLMRSPGFMPRRSRISLGMVVRPFVGQRCGGCHSRISYPYDLIVRRGFEIAQLLPRNLRLLDHRLPSRQLAPDVSAELFR